MEMLLSNLNHFSVLVLCTIYFCLFILLRTLISSAPQRLLKNKMISFDYRIRGGKGIVGLVVLKWISFIVYMPCIFSLKLCYFENITTGQKYCE